MSRTDLFLYLAIVLFTIGMVGVLICRNALVAFMCIEIMLNAANLALVSFAHMHGDMRGHIYVFLVMAVAAAEVAVGLAIIIQVFKQRSTVNLSDMRQLRG